jgi:hypothetical protein
LNDNEMTGMNNNGSRRNSQRFAGPPPTAPSGRNDSKENKSINRQGSTTSGFGLQ